MSCVHALLSCPSFLLHCMYMYTVHVRLSTVIFIHPVLVYSVYSQMLEKYKGWQASRTSSCTLNQAPSSCRFNHITYTFTRIVGLVLNKNRGHKVQLKRTTKMLMKPTNCLQLLTHSHVYTTIHTFQSKIFIIF